MLSENWGVRCRVSGKGDVRYWHLVWNYTKLKANRRTAEYRISKGGFALRGVGATTPTSRRLRSVIFYKIDRIPYFEIRNSKFIIRYSLFNTNMKALICNTRPKFLSRLNWPLFRPAAPLVWNFMKSNDAFVEFHMRFQSTDFLLVLHPLRYSDFEDEHEDEYEKNQIKSHAYALRPQPYTM